MKISSSHNNYSESPSAEDAENTKGIFFRVHTSGKLDILYTYYVYKASHWLFTYREK